MTKQATTINEYDLHPMVKKVSGIIALLYALLIAATLFIDVPESVIGILGVVTLITIAPTLTIKAKIWVKRD